MKSTRLKHSILGVSALALALTATLGGAPRVSAQQVNFVERGQRDYHTVEDGDTLYDLSGRYLRDVYEWPKLWSYNPHITNPHWIYPGDIVYLRAAGEGPARATGPTVVSSSSNGATQLHMAVGGFIEHEELKYVGRIVASPKQATMLAEHDTVWVGFGDDAYTADEKEDTDAEDRAPMKSTEREIKAGDTFAIVRPVGTITDKEDEDNVLGHKYVVLGALTMTEMSKKHLHTAEINQSWFEIERGDLLVPYEQQLKNAQLIQADRDMVAEIVDTLQPITHLGEMHYVYVNKGADDGVRSGNRFYVFQKREGLQKIEDKAKDEIPWERVGQVLLIDVRKNYSMAVVIDSKRELLLGDRLEMYEGY